MFLTVKSIKNNKNYLCNNYLIRKKGLFEVFFLITNTSNAINENELKLNYPLVFNTIYLSEMITFVYIK